MTIAWDDLHTLRSLVGEGGTVGLGDQTIQDFLAHDLDLREAIGAALQQAQQLAAAGALESLLAPSEDHLCNELQQNYLIFYGAEARSPYVPLAARGPWIVTLHGAVLHDSGGYGMLGLGHAPAAVVDKLAQPWVMANVMTPSLSQKKFATALQQEIGHTLGACPYPKFICLNSGSESVTMAARITDLHAFQQTAPGAPHAGKTVKYLSLAGGFHGRTDPAARISGSTLGTYRSHLASFRNKDQLVLVEPNDLQGLQAAFDQAALDGVFFEGFFIEPVMGEGEPGLALTPEFYALARQLTTEHGSLLMCDSIQAGFRATGHLSIVDYPGFAGLGAPDLETFSKALNAGQYPLSVLALQEEAAALYRTGIYGNTMTTCPRGLEVGCVVLESMTDDLRRNIVDRGKQLLQGLKMLQESCGDGVLGVEGTGLMVNMELDPITHPVNGKGGLEEQMRRQGIHMIHGGHNGLRFTPHFGISAAQVDLIVATVGKLLMKKKVAVF